MRGIRGVGGGCVPIRGLKFLYASLTELPNRGKLLKVQTNADCLSCLLAALAIVYALFDALSV